MSTSYNPNMSVNGLSLYLDAANSNSYSGTGTLWSDLSKNSINGTLINTPTFVDQNSGYFTFDGLNEYVQCSGSIVTSAATIICWINRNGSQDSYTGILYSRGTSITGLNFYGTTNKISYTWNGAVNTYTWDSGLVVPDSEWCMCAISVSGSSAVAYLGQSSGITSSVNNVSHGSTTLDDIKIGQDEIGGRFYDGNLSQALVYNRSLGAEEIKQNFHAFRGRYGI